MQELVFDWQYIGEVVNSDKTATIRLDRDDNIQVGYALFQDKEHDTFAIANITEVINTTVKDSLDIIDDKGHNYNDDSVVGLSISLNAHYDEKIKPETEVKVVLYNIVMKYGVSKRIY